METNARIVPLRGRIPQWELDDRLRKVRRDMKMTQEQLAAELGVGVKAYGAWEAGTNRPADVLEVATAMERVSGVPKTWFIGWMDEPLDAPDDGAGRRPSDYKVDAVIVELASFRERRADALESAG